MITQEKLKQMLDYEPETGVFLWKQRADGRGFGRRKVGTVQHQGYIRIRLDGRAYFAQRLAWLYVYGKWPKHVVDHINRKKDDNRIANLRDVPRGHNAVNSGLPSHNTSGSRGVRFHKPNGKWKAVIGGNSRHLGYFQTKEEAEAAYLKAAVLEYNLPQGGSPPNG